MPLRYRANKLPTSRLSCERDKQRQPNPARIWRPLIATDGLSRSSPFGARHGCGESAEAGAAHEDVRPWRDCDISRLAHLALALPKVRSRRASARDLLHP
jgi:hypothetical protein